MNSKKIRRKHRENQDYEDVVEVFYFISTYLILVNHRGKVIYLKETVEDTKVTNRVVYELSVETQV